MTKEWIVTFACALLGMLEGGAVIPSIRHYTHRSIRTELALLVGCGLLGAAAGLTFVLPAALTYASFFSLLLAVSIVDARTQEIPDIFQGMMLAVGAVSCFTVPELLWWERLAGVLCVSVPLLLLSLWKEGAFGGGDIKLVACSGLILGLRCNIIAAFLAILCGGLYGIWLLAAHRAGRKDHFAFGPFLCAGMIISVFWGNEILHWYLSLCGFPIT